MDNIRKIHTKIFSYDSIAELEKAVEKFFDKGDMELNSISYSHSPKKIKKGNSYETYANVEVYNYSVLLTYYKN